MAERARVQAPAASAPQRSHGLLLQRKPKLTVNEPGDRYEQEAERMAEMVTRPAGSFTHRHDAGALDSGPVVRPPELRLSRSSAAGAIAADVPPIVHDALASPGQSLDASTRAYMEPRFGHHFGNVRVHTDARAAESAQSVHALAYTVGRDVVFGPGQYAPGDLRGRQLLAHELTHVVQQQGATASTLQRKVEVAPGLKLDTMGYTTTKAGDVYSAPKVVKKGSVFNEIFTSLFASPRTFKLDGTTDAEVSSNLKQHIEARQGVITFASKKKYKFGAGPAFKMNPKYWSAPLVPKAGVDPQEAMEDVNKNPKEYAIACLAATKITMVGGAKSNYINKPSSDATDWVPGDWGYIKNNKFSGKPEDVGLEGENIIYVGKDQFWGHFTGTNTYRTLKEWTDEVQSWNLDATLKDQRRCPIKGLK